MQLLLAEDDEVLADALVEQLTHVGYRVEHALNGPVAEYLLTKHAFDVAILDIGLPMMDGLAVMKKARQLDPDLPVVILTALDQLDSRIAGLRAGADDYITKPFSFAELELRLQALLRRAKPSAAPSEVRNGGVVVDRTTRRAQVDGKAVELTPRETTLLELFLAHQGKVVTKEQIAAAWSNAGNEPGIGNVAEIHVHRLRRKLEGSQLSIRTVRGLGYMLESEP
jgi:two-component system OmpR family response regulator